MSLVRPTVSLGWTNYSWFMNSFDSWSARLVSILPRADLVSQIDSLTSQLDMSSSQLVSSNELAFISKTKHY
jgi:hypothetical protein